MPIESVLGPLPDGWRYEMLGDVCIAGGGGIQTGPFGSQLHASDYVKHGIPSIMPQNIGDNRVVEDGIARISPADAQRLERYLVQPGDIVYSRRGDVERRALIRQHEAGWLCGTGCLRVRVGNGGVDATYASYYFGHRSVREWIVRHAQGATMPNLNTSILAACPFVVPPLEEQRAMAYLLAALDDKVELNRRASEMLEGISRALFSDVLAHAEAASWPVRPLGDCVAIAGGGTPPTGEPAFWEEGVHAWATPKDLSRLSTPVLLHTERRITDAGLRRISSGLLPPGTVLLSSRAPIGYLAINEIPVVINQGFIAIAGTAALPNLFLLRWLEHNHAEIVARANGSTFLEINKASFRAIPIAVPAQSVIDQFMASAAALHAKLVLLQRESATLIELRDSLLPRLLSGELRLRDAEREVAVAT